MMDKAEFLERATNSNLERVALAISDHIAKSIRISTSKAEDVQHTPKRSKIGGSPDLPVNMQWPSWQNTNLSFLAQINLSDIANYSLSHDLPKTGLLSFFYHPEQATWGFDPNDKGSWRVFYFSENIELKQSSNPKPKDFGAYYPECAVKFTIADSYPDDFSDLIHGFELTREEEKSYWSLLELARGDYPHHQIFGHPYIIQNPMELECQLVTNGIYCGDAKQFQNPRFEELKDGAKDWRLLFQLDSDDNADMVWGDGGMLYFWIREDDLRYQRFEKVWMILQCT